MFQVVKLGKIYLFNSLFHDFTSPTLQQYTKSEAWLITASLNIPTTILKYTRHTFTNVVSMLINDTISRYWYINSNSRTSGINFQILKKGEILFKNKSLAVNSGMTHVHGV